MSTASSAPAVASIAEQASNKRTRTLVTPEGIAVPIVVASRAARLGALVLDFVLIAITLIAIQLLLIWIASGLFRGGGGGTGGQIGGALEFVFILYVLVLFFARYAYFLMMELGPRGATFGKRAVGIRVAARNGARLTPEAVIARNLIRDIELFLPFGLLMVAPSGEYGSFGFAGLAWFIVIISIPFFNKDALRAGDIIAGTWVVEAPRTKLADALSTQGSAAAESSSTVTGQRYEFGEEELSIYGEKELQTLERMLREGKDDALEAVHAAICRKIGWDPGAGDERAFLEAFYGQLRKRLENDMRFGKRKADKHS
ncbi:MAG: RDD family protein [Pseudomonadota bacterium]